MKKANILLALSSAALLASCGGGQSASASGLSVSQSASASGLSVSQSASGLSVSTGYSYPTYVPPTIPSTLEQKAVEIKLWCASEVKDLTEVQAARFVRALGWAGDITVTVEAMGEGDAASEMIKDVDAGADIYFFAQDQLSRLVTARAVTEVTGELLQAIKNDNVASAVSAGAVGEKIYAYPATADNGYYLYYDGSKFTAEDAADWEKLVKKAEDTNIEVDYEYTSAWYNYGFFYGAGCDSIWETDADGHFVDYEDTFNTDKGLDAIRALANIVTSSAVVSNSSIGKVGEKCAALVSGTWDYAKCVERWGENLKCAELPYFTTKAGQRVHTGSFSGNKLVGVKPQTDASKKFVCDYLAAYLTNEISQGQRFQAKSWGPSNKNIAESSMVKAAPHLAALAAQNQYAKPQGQFPGGWWDAAGKNFGDGIKAASSVDDTLLRNLLATYEAGLDEMLNG